jgi:hypothetical protein
MITKYIDREKLLLDKIKQSIRIYGEIDGPRILDILYPDKLDEIEKDGKRYVEEPELGADTDGLAEDIIELIERDVEEVNNLFTFLDDLDLDYFGDNDRQIIMSSDYWYKIFERGKWGEHEKKTQTDPDYTTWSMEKLVDRQFRKEEQDD